MADDATRDSGWRLGYRPQLDGIRGLAIVAVVIHHTPLRQVVPGGFLGVDLFFVLSGFLITALLLEEYTDTGSIRPLRFLGRRMLRLLPALFVLLIFCCCLALGCRSSTRATSLYRSVLLTLSYCANWYWFFSVPLHYLAHAWTLALEEQFYLIWPLFVIVLVRLPRPMILGILASGLAASALLRVMVWDGPGTVSHHLATTCLATRADSLLAGCILGLVATWGWLPSARVLRLPSAVAALFLAYSLFTVNEGDAYLYRGGFTLIAAAAAVWLAGLLQEPTQGRAARRKPAGYPASTGGLTPRRSPLVFAPLVWIGRLSYGIYLWHFPLFALVPGWLRKLGISGEPVVWGIEIGLTLAVAAISYYAIEQPIRRWGRGLTPSHP